MLYELCKQLRDAGFPQLHELPGSNFNGRFLYEGDTLKSVYIPTLEEVLEACGKPVMLMGFKEEKYGWQAFNDTTSICAETGEGSTPLIAVARLWLALNPPTKAGV